MKATVVLSLALAAVGCGRIGYGPPALTDAGPNDRPADLAQTDVPVADTSVDDTNRGDTNGGDTNDGETNDAATITDTGSADRGASIDSTIDASDGASAGPTDTRPPMDANVAPDAAPLGNLSTLVEGFNQPLGSQLFAYSDGPCTDSVSGGAFRIALTGVSGKYCGVQSTVYFTPSGSLVIDSMGFSAPVAGLVVYIQIADAASNSVEINLAAGVLNLNVLNPSRASRATMTYSATSHRYWRLTPTSSTVTGELSPDGTTWSPLGTIPTPLTGNVYVNFGAGYFTTGAATTVVLPGFNAP